MKLKYWLQDKEGGEGGGQGGGQGDAGKGGQGDAGKGGQGDAGKGGQGGGGQGQGQGGQGDAGKPGEVKWPDNWREAYAGNDEKKLGVIKRYGSPTAALDALLAAQAKISSGELKQALPKDADEAAIKAWRAENGIPESPDKYEVKLEDGLVMGEQDKPMVDKFVAEMHKAHAHPSHVNAALNTYYKLQEEAVAAQQQADETFQRESEDKLRVEMGTDFRTNMNIVKNFISTAPSGLGERLMGARLADGRMLGDDPDALRWLTELGRKTNPVATVTGGVGPAAMDSLNTELANLKKMMGDHESEYWKGPNADKNQARYRELAGALAAAGKK